MLGGEDDNLDDETLINEGEEETEANPTEQSGE